MLEETKEIRKLNKEKKIVTAIICVIYLFALIYSLLFYNSSINLAFSTSLFVIGYYLMDSEYNKRKKTIIQNYEK